MTKIGFNPCNYGFKRLDISHQGLTFFERDLHIEPIAKPDLLRLNVYLTQDGSFVTIWSGLFDPALSDGILPINGSEDIDFGEMYNENLFRGYIETEEEARVIFKALRLEKYRPNVLEADRAGRLVCSALAWTPLPLVEEQR
jgi:hypothetical protein